MIIVFASGVLAGFVHVLSGPDHVAAVAPFTTEKWKRSWMTGFLWGIGHTGGVWLVGLLAFILREALPVELLSAWSERLVGIMLIAIGLWGIRRALKTRIHYHHHTHDGVRHTHFHAHSETGERHHEVEHRHSHAPLGIGLLHGLAGSSHFLGILPALMLPTRSAAISYVAGFGIACILAMTMFSWLLGILMHKLSLRSLWAYQLISVGFALMAVGVGVFWLFITF